MKNAAASLIHEREVVSAVLVLDRTVHAFELVRGILVGSHSDIADEDLPKIQERLASMVDGWQQAGKETQLTFSAN